MYETYLNLNKKKRRHGKHVLNTKNSVGSKQAEEALSSKHGLYFMKREKLLRGQI